MKPLRPTKRSHFLWHQDAATVELQPRKLKGEAVVWDVSRGTFPAEKETGLVGMLGRSELMHHDLVPVDVIAWTQTGLVLTRLEYAARCLSATIEIDPDRYGGAPVVRGTRFPVARVIAELADNRNLAEFAEDYDLDANTLRTMLEGFAAYLDRPLTR